MVIEPFVPCPKHARMDVVRLQALADQALGERYIDASACGQMDTVVARASGCGSILGFIVFDVRNDRAELRTIVVDVDHQGRGVGSGLCRAVMKAHAKAAMRWWSPAWVHEGAVPADKLLRGLGLAPSFDVENYWFEDSLARGYDCPACGHPCRCTARIYESLASTAARDFGDSPLRNRSHP